MLDRQVSPVMEIFRPRLVMYKGFMNSGLWCSKDGGVLTS